MILIISTCKEKLHEMEFVKPIEKILKEDNKHSKTKHYSKLTKSDLQKSNKIIICGTSLKDDEFLKNIEHFEFIKDYKKPILGICAGHQIISLIHDDKTKLKKKTEIGYYFEFFEKEFLSLEKRHEVYHLHKNYTTLPKDFIKYTDSKIPQAIKHKTKPIYGVLFHPEVRNKKLIEEFLKL
jgi:GMP synthase-like glutamine amidotransferase